MRERQQELLKILSVTISTTAFLIIIFLCKFLLGLIGRRYRDHRVNDFAWNSLPPLLVIWHHSEHRTESLRVQFPLHFCNTIYVPSYLNSWSWTLESLLKGLLWRWSRTKFFNYPPQSKGQHLMKSKDHTITVFSVSNYRYCIRSSWRALGHFGHIPRAESAGESYLVVKNHRRLLWMHMYLIISGHLWYMQNPLQRPLLLFESDGRLTEILKTHAIRHLAFLRL